MSWVGLTATLRSPLCRAPHCHPTGPSTTPLGFPLPPRGPPPHPARRRGRPGPSPSAPPAAGRTRCSSTSRSAWPRKAQRGSVPARSPLPGPARPALTCCTWKRRQEQHRSAQNRCAIPPPALAMATRAFRPRDAPATSEPPALPPSPPSSSPAFPPLSSRCPAPVSDRERYIGTNRDRDKSLQLGHQAVLQAASYPF